MARDRIMCLVKEKAALESEVYLIWSHEHGLWWRPHSAGYCVAVDDAGWYSYDEAISICKQRDGFDPKERPSEVMVPMSMMMACKEK
jgi:hypothetical protein